MFHSGGSKPNCAAPLFNQRDNAIRDSDASRLCPASVTPATPPPGAGPVIECFDAGRQKHRPFDEVEIVVDACLRLAVV